VFSIVWAGIYAVNSDKMHQIKVEKDQERAI
jgi:hypothetical protein